MIEFIVDDWKYPDDAIGLPDKHVIDGDWKYTATQAASYFVWECDGWEYGEDNWPVVIELFEDGVSLGKYKVGYEMEPYFYCEGRLKDETV
jgi:hypothetical protein